MPQVVAGKIVQALALKGFAALAVEAITYVAFAVAANKVARRRFEREIESDNRLRSRRVLSRGTLTPRTVIYGRTTVSGQLVYINTTGAAGAPTYPVYGLYMAIVHCAHEVDQIHNYIYDDDPDQIDISGGDISDGSSSTVNSSSAWYALANGQYSAEIESHFGTDAQTKSSLLSTEFSSDFTDDHKGLGLCYSVHKFQLFQASQSVFDGGPPQTILADISGRKVYDPRLDSTNGGSGSHRYTDSTTWEYSNNPILCGVDYMANFAKSTVAYTEFNWSVIAAQADICDAIVTSAATESPIPQQARYACNGELSLADSDAENIGAILSSCAGWISKSAGRWALYAGAYQAPSVSLDEDDIVGDIVVKTALSRRNRFNSVKAIYFSNAIKNKTESAPLTDSGFVARDNNQDILKTIDLPMTADEYQAQRIAFKKLQQSDQQKIAVVPLKWVGLGIAVNDNVQLTYSAFGWSNKVFKCSNWVLGDDDAPVRVELREDSSSTWADPDADDYRVLYDDGTVAPDPVEVLPITNLSATPAIGGVLVAWDLPITDQINFVRIYASTDSAWANATLVYEGYNDEFLHHFNANDTSPEVSDRYYWGRVVFEGEESNRTPNSDTSSITASRGEAGAVDLADGSVTSDKLAGASVIAVKIDTGAVTENKIGSAAVTADKIDSSAVTQTKINDGSVSTSKIASTAVTTAKLASSSVTEAKINNSAVTENKLGTGAVTENKLGNGAVTTTKMGAGSVTDEPVVLEDSDGNISYSVSSQPGFELQGQCANSSYTAPSSGEARVRISFYCRAQISGATSGTSVGKAYLFITLYYYDYSNSPGTYTEVFSKNFIIEGYTTSSDQWGFMSGVIDVEVAANVELFADVTVGRIFTTSGSSPAQTIYWEDPIISIGATKR